LLPSPRATRAIERDASLLKSLPELIDRETGVREVLEILENIIAESGDLVERSISVLPSHCFADQFGSMMASAAHFAN